MFASRSQNAPRHNSLGGEALERLRQELAGRAHSVTATSIAYISRCSSPGGVASFGRSGWRRRWCSAWGGPASLLGRAYRERTELAEDPEWRSADLVSALAAYQQALEAT